MGEITLEYLLGVATKRWALISAVLIATTAAVGLVTVFVLTPVYKSTAVVLLKPGREFVFESGPGDRTALPRQMDGIVRAELEILHSQDLHRDVVRSLGPLELYPHLASDGGPIAVYRWLRNRVKAFVSGGEGGVSDPLHGAVAAFRQDLSATAVPGTEVIRISFYHPDPRVAAEAVNTLVEQLKEHHLRAFSAPQSTIFLESKVDHYYEELGRKEEKLRTAQEDQPILAVENPAEVLEQQRAQVELALAQTQNEIAALNTRVRYLKEQAESLSRTSPLHEEIEAQIVSSTAEVYAQIGRRKGLEHQLAELEQALQQLPNHLRAYRDLLRERDASERRYRIYAERLEQALVSEEMDSQRIANISVIQQGRPEPKPTRPKKLLNLVVGAAMGLGMGLGLALLVEGWGTQEAPVA
ncbi:MAG: hypothetical protein JSU66_01260 [Deltaproteobacteria bacterium]|nr:MAG: hypothetical protein JSU66_01260 [Deltaproteobacteria bacterium]